MINAKIISPKSEQELLSAIENLKEENYRFGAGYTDLILELKKTPEEQLTIINLAGLNEEAFKSISFEKNTLRIGSLVTALELSRNDRIKKEFPVLHMAADMLASKQIRQVATIGGNMCTASPAGDISTALVAINANCEILSSTGQVRTTPISEFFKGVRKTDLQKDEVLKSVLIPIEEVQGKIMSEFIKIGTRNAMECSIVSLAYHFNLDYKGTVNQAGIAIGSSAPIIKFTQSAVDFIINMNINEINDKLAADFADKVVEYSDPISDVRGSAWYRKKVLYNISKGIFNNT